MPWLLVVPVLLCLVAVLLLCRVALTLHRRLNAETDRASNAELSILRLLRSQLDNRAADHKSVMRIFEAQSRVNHSQLEAQRDLLKRVGELESSKGIGPVDFRKL